MSKKNVQGYYEVCDLQATQAQGLEDTKQIAALLHHVKKECTGASHCQCCSCIDNIRDDCQGNSNTTHHQSSSSSPSGVDLYNLAGAYSSPIKSEQIEEYTVVTEAVDKKTEANVTYFVEVLQEDNCISCDALQETCIKKEEKEEEIRVQDASFELGEEDKSEGYYEVCDLQATQAQGLEDTKQIAALLHHVKKECTGASHCQCCFCIDNIRDDCQGNSNTTHHQLSSSSPSGVDLDNLAGAYSSPMKSEQIEEYTIVKEDFDKKTEAKVTYSVEVLQGEDNSISCDALQEACIKKEEKEEEIRVQDATLELGEEDKSEGYYDVCDLQATQAQGLEDTKQIAALLHHVKKECTGASHCQCCFCIDNIRDDCQGNSNTTHHQLSSSSPSGVDLNNLAGAYSSPIKSEQIEEYTIVKEDFDKKTEAKVTYSAEVLQGEDNSISCDALQEACIKKEEKEEEIRVQDATLELGEEDKSETLCAAGGVQDVNKQSDTQELGQHAATLFDAKKVVSGEGPNQPYKYNVCGAAYSSHSHLKIHLSTHNTKRKDLLKFKCTMCDQARAKKDDLIKHFRIHTGERPYQCDLCDKTYRWRSNLTVHRRTHMGERPYGCHLCKKAYFRKGNLTNHMKTHTGERLYECHLCKKAFFYKLMLTNHMKTHTGERPYKCSICDKAFMSNYNLKSHEKTHTGDKPYKCDLCNISCARLAHLKIHIRKHTGEKWYRCYMCPKGFFQKECLTTHIRSHTQEKLHSCTFCGKEFTHKKHLVRHYRIHMNIKPIRCVECGELFRHKTNLNRHKSQIHKDSLPFVCNVCDLEFPSREVLIAHRDTHTEDPPWMCHICNRSFRIKSKRDEHILIHSGYKPFKCKYCPSAFVANHKLQRHLKIHTQDFSHLCPFCGKGFIEKCNMVKHLNIHTREI